MAAGYGSSRYGEAEGARPSVARCPETRWSWVEIDRGALRANVRAYKKLLGRNTKMMCVVKADAYGHGAAVCAPIMASAGADAFAVATVQEGVELREFVDKPILLLCQPPQESIPDLLAYDIMPSVYTIEFALAFGEYAANAGTQGHYHLALDTGMTRIGVRYQDAVDFRRAVDFHSGLVCEGTFTHFATADVVGDWDWELQRAHFDEAVANLREAGFDPGLVHCDNTPSVVLHSDTHYDMVRVGVGLYGLHPCDASEPLVDLKPVMSVRARVTRAQYPPVGAGVSYGMTYRVPKSSIQIATVPLGYADGYSRTLSNKADVIVAGQRHHQVGNVCMDQFMFAVDVNENRSYAPSAPVEEGDLVTIMGADGRERISAEELAELRGTINYEVVCDFGLRLEKVYV